MIDDIPEELTIIIEKEKNLQKISEKRKFARTKEKTKQHKALQRLRKEKRKRKVKQRKK